MKPWLEKALKTHHFHIERLREDESWRLEDTSRELKRSLGGVSEDLLIVEWLKTNREEIEGFSYANKALMFIREQQKIKRFDEVE